MDSTLYRCAQVGGLDVLVQYNKQLHRKLNPNGCNLLHVSAQFHDSTEFVDEILNTQNFEDRRCLLKQKNSEGETALHIASRNGRYNIVRLLIEHLRLLDQEDHESGVKLAEDMMRAADSNGDTPLHVAVKNNHKEVPKLLLTKDRDFEHPINRMNETPLYLAIERNNHDIVNSILTICKSPNYYEGPDGKSALHAAVLSNCKECVNHLLEKQPDLTKQADESGWIPLHYAAYESITLPLARLLLNVDRSTTYVTISKGDNKKALHIAASRGVHRVMEELLQQCPDCWDMFTTKRKNVLHLAVENKQETTLQFILDQTWAINLINHKDVEGNTPIHLYAKGASMNFRATRLLKHPLVDWNAFNEENLTPLDLLYTPGKLDQDVSEVMFFPLWRKLDKSGAQRGGRKLTSIDNDSKAYEKRNTVEKKQRAL